MNKNKRELLKPEIREKNDEELIELLVDHLLSIHDRIGRMSNKFFNYIPEINQIDSETPFKEIPPQFNPKSICIRINAEISWLQTDKIQPLVIDEEFWPPINKA